ncbi:MAG TPA: riboflavin synthase [Terriglobales bacterium]|nr:riboflavin synthase [Terriglobales bacterium]
MFTGIIEEVGTISRLIERDGTRRMTVSSTELVKQLKQGGSIAVSGVCLTAVEISSSSFRTDLATETWNRTSFSRIHEGALVNLELPMRADGRFDGHIVQGHVDGTGKFLGLERIPGADDYWMHIELPAELQRYTIFKGSLAVEGISLTVANIESSKVTIALIPHTWEMTNLKSLKPGDLINLEVDMVAKYVEKMLGLRGESARAGTSNTELTIKELVKQGF